MRKIIVGEFVTLDGVMQAPGGADEDTEGGFVHGGWTWPFWHDDIGSTLMEAIGRCDTLLLGRKTWQIHGDAFEPMGDSPENPFVGFRKIVVSKTLTSTALWSNSTLVSENVVEEIRKLKEQPGKDIYVDGSHLLVHTLVENDLVDEYRLLIYPVVLGSGKKLFPNGTRVNLQLVETKSFPTGVMWVHYQPKRN